MAFRSGAIAVVGRPNVGKSSLVNRLVGEKIAIVTPVPLTTRAPQVGIVTRPDAQLLLVDTPAIHQPRNRLGHLMVEAARAAAADADLVLLVLDASAGVTAQDRQAAALAGRPGRTLAVLNKIDRRPAGVGPGTPAPDVAALGASADVLTVSAATGEDADRLAAALAVRLPEGPRYFPPDALTDQPEQVLVRELIREQAMRLTRQEVPHGLAVEIEEYAVRPNAQLTYIRAVVFVEREGHRRILIGQGGRMMKEIGRRARPAIEARLGSRVYLDLWVKVARGWRNDEAFIRRLYPFPPP